MQDFMIQKKALLVVSTAIMAIRNEYTKKVE